MFLSSSKSIRLVTGAILFALLGAPASTHAKPPAKHKARNQIQFVVSVDGNRGQVACGLFIRSGWLTAPVKPAFSRIKNKRAVCVFNNLKPGVYAISAFHDENKNRELDTNFLGIPTEDWCTSRNAKAILGPPNFDDAKFRYRGGKAVLRASM